MAPEAQRPFAQRARQTLSRFFVTCLVLGLAAIAAFLAAELNARTFTLEEENGHVVVMKGRNLPMGALPYRPADAWLADTYAPIPIEGYDASSLLKQRFTERDELNRALFSLLESLAKPRIADTLPTRVEQGLYYLRRAQKLTGLTEEQRRSLTSLQAEVAFYQARQKLEEARKQVAEALVQLKLASESGNRHAPAANQMLSGITPAARALEEALRMAVYAPGAAAPTPAAAPPVAPLPSTDAGTSLPTTSTPHE